MSSRQSSSLPAPSNGTLISSWYFSCRQPRQRGPRGLTLDRCMAYRVCLAAGGLRPNENESRADDTTTEYVSSRTTTRKEDPWKMNHSPRPRLGCALLDKRGQIKV